MCIVYTRSANVGNAHSFVATVFATFAVHALCSNWPSISYHFNINAYILYCIEYNIWYSPKYYQYEFHPEAFLFSGVKIRRHYYWETMTRFGAGVRMIWRRMASVFVSVQRFVYNIYRPIRALSINGMDVRAQITALLFCIYKWLYTRCVRDVVRITGGIVGGCCSLNRTTYPINSARMKVTILRCQSSHWNDFESRAYVCVGLRLCVMRHVGCRFLFGDGLTIARLY